MQYLLSMEKFNSKNKEWLEINSVWWSEKKYVVYTSNAFTILLYSMVLICCVFFFRLLFSLSLLLLCVCASRLVFYFCSFLFRQQLFCSLRHCTNITLFSPFPSLIHFFPKHSTTPPLRRMNINKPAPADRRTRNWIHVVVWVRVFQPNKQLHLSSCVMNIFHSRKNIICSMIVTE